MSFYRHDSSASGIEKRYESVIPASVAKTWKELCLTSSSLPSVVEAMADVMPALREFCTRDWEQVGRIEKRVCLI